MNSSRGPRNSRSPRSRSSRFLPSALIPSGKGAQFAVGLSLLCLGSWTLPSAAQAQETGGSDVSLNVVLVYGSADEGEIDSKLVGMQEYLQKRLPMRFGTLQQFDAQQFDLALGEMVEVALPSGSEVNVLPIAIVNGRLHLYLEMPGVNTRLQITSGRPVILGGPAHQNGHILVELTSRFSPGLLNIDDEDELGPRDPKLPPPLPSSRRAETPNIDVQNAGAERSPR